MRQLTKILILLFIGASFLLCFLFVRGGCISLNNFPSIIIINKYPTFQKQYYIWCEDNEEVYDSFPLCKENLQEGVAKNMIWCRDKKYKSLTPCVKHFPDMYKAIEIKEIKFLPDILHLFLIISVLIFIRVFYSMRIFLK